MKKPKISIIILNWNNYDNTRECLNSLRNINNNFEAIIVDNGSTDGSFNKLSREFSEFKHLQNKKNVGFARGNNIGIEESLKNSNIEYIFCLNNDTTVESSILDKLLEIVGDEKYKNYGSFQPKMIWYYHRNLIDSVGLLYSKNSLGFNRGGFESIEKYDEQKEIFGCCGGAVLYRREAVEQLIKEDGEFFDKEFFAYYEDMDVAFRLQWRGWRSLYVPKAIVFHKRGGSQEGTLKKSLYWGHRNNVWVIAKNLPTVFILKNFIFIVLAQIISVVINFIKHGKLGFVILKAKIDGWKQFSKIRVKAKTIRKNVKEWERTEQFIIMKWRVKKPKHQ